jgi:hypothetical protein
MRKQGGWFMSSVIELRKVEKEHVIDPLRKCALVKQIAHPPNDSQKSQQKVNNIQLTPLPLLVSGARLVAGPFGGSFLELSTSYQTPRSRC